MYNSFNEFKDKISFIDSIKLFSTFKISKLTQFSIPFKLVNELFEISIFLNEIGKFWNFGILLFEMYNSIKFKNWDKFDKIVILFKFKYKISVSGLLIEGMFVNFFLLKITVFKFFSLWILS